MVDILKSENHASEVAAGRRFEFGANWQRYLAGLSQEKVTKAESSLRKLLKVESLEGCRFLDIGSGSGLFSLAARNLGAEVLSFDFDPQSVACTRGLRDRRGDDDESWRVLSGSVLDADFLRSLGSFDYVYSWGVLHHTGSMWRAIENAAIPLRPGGKLSIALYNDQGVWSRRWLRIKRTYNRMPRPLRPLFAALAWSPIEAKMILSALVRLKPMEYVRLWTDYDRDRGMTRWRDIVDWIGGLPFEVAKPEEVFDFMVARGFELEGLRTRAGSEGCNEFLFRRRTTRLPATGTDLAP